MFFRLLAVTLLIVPAGPALAYDFKGAALGMNLSQFRALPPQKHETDTLAFVSCTGDHSDVAFFDVNYLTEVEKQLGIVKCAWFIAPDKTAYRYSYRDALITVGNYYAHDLLYKFVSSNEDGKGEPLLYEITLTAALGALASITSGLEGKFGLPSKVSRATVQNMFGATFPKSSYLWRRSGEEIVLEAPSVDLETLSLEYRVLKLSTFVHKATKSAAGEPRDKM